MHADQPGHGARTPTYVTHNAPTKTCCIAGRKVYSRSSTGRGANRTSRKTANRFRRLLRACLHANVAPQPPHRHWRLHGTAHNSSIIIHNPFPHRYLQRLSRDADADCLHPVNLACPLRSLGKGGQQRQPWSPLHPQTAQGFPIASIVQPIYIFPASQTVAVQE